MIKMIFGGGLGNQMFQYAFLYANMIQNEQDKIEAIMHRNRNEDRREYALQNYSCSLNLNIQDKIEDNKEYKQYLFKRKILCNFFKKLGFSNNKVASLMSKFGIIFTPNVYEYYTDLKITKNTVIEGGFQNWRYFDAIKDNLRKEFSLKEKLSKECEDYKDKMNSCNSVCVHIRRGDYLNSYYSSTLAVCDDEYYKLAIELIEKEVKDPEFFVFTNTHEDHLWIQKNYQFKGKVHYVDMNNPDYLELFLMSRCKHFIISNSTFSWWAQYLSESDNKIVVAPSIWYRGNTASKGIYMPEWKLISVK